MTDRELLDAIIRTEWIADMLAFFDFDAARAAKAWIESVTLADGEPLKAIAGDASGGSFLLIGEGATRPVLYIGSEGEGGLIATSLREALALIVGISSLHDATAFPIGEDDGRNLYDFLVQADAEIREDWPELDNDRDRLREALALPRVDEKSLRSLQTAAANISYRPIDERGERYRPMLAWLREAEESERPTTPASPAASTPPAARQDEPIPGQLGLF